jgi:L-rhamnose mutarotase
MQKVAFKMFLHKGFEEEYTRRHADIWPELKSLLTATGITDYAIFLDKETLQLTGVLTIADAKKLDELPNHPIMQKWWLYMADIMQTNGDHSPVSIPLEQVFYLP